MGERLIDKLDLTVGEILHWDLGLGLAGAAGAAWMELNSTAASVSALPVAAGIVGVVIGAVIGGVAIVVAFMDSVFIRKLGAIDTKPIRYVTPFVFTAFLGVLGAISLVVFSDVPSSAPDWFRSTLAAISGLFTIWTLASLIPVLSVLVDFVKLKTVAAEVPDEFMESRPQVVRPPDPQERGPS